MESELVNARTGTAVDAPGLFHDNTPPAPSNELGKDEFLQLLVAQLKYQDPLNPSSSDEFISTTAQFTVVEKLDELTKQGENSALVNSLTTASSLIGREVTANRNGVNVTAVVEGSQIVSGKVELVTKHGPIELQQIVTVAAPPVPEPVLPTPVTPAPVAPEPSEETGPSDTGAEAGTETAVAADTSTGHDQGDGGEISAIDENNPAAEAGDAALDAAPEPVPSEPEPTVAVPAAPAAPEIERTESAGLDEAEPVTLPAAPSDTAPDGEPSAAVEPEILSPVADPVDVPVAEPSAAVEPEIGSPVTEPVDVPVAEPVADLADEVGAAERPADQTTPIESEPQSGEEPASDAVEDLFDPFQQLD